MAYEPEGRSSIAYEPEGRSSITCEPEGRSSIGCEIRHRAILACLPALLLAACQATTPAPAPVPQPAAASPAVAAAPQAAADLTCPGIEYAPAAGILLPFTAEPKADAFLSWQKTWASPTPASATGVLRRVECSCTEQRPFDAGMGPYLEKHLVDFFSQVNTEKGIVTAPAYRTVGNQGHFTFDGTAPSASGGNLAVVGRLVLGGQCRLTLLSFVEDDAKAGPGSAARMQEERAWQMATERLAATAAGNDPTPAVTPASPDAAARLRQLDSLRDDGLITPAEYDDRRRAILGGP